MIEGGRKGDGLQERGGKVRVRGREGEKGGKG